jgi:muramoyltetrapeptide carboxypeptidase
MIRPPVLHSDDKAVIVSPAGTIDSLLLDKAAAVLCEWGLSVEIAPNALSQTGRFSGFVDQRLADLQTAMDDPEVKLIFCSRGGYGVIHLLDKLNFEGIRQFPKWLVGFSDITALHAVFQKNGIISFHAPMAKHLAEEGPSDISVRFMKSVLFGGHLKYDLPAMRYDFLNRLGQSSGTLFGGNLSVFCSLLGTKYVNIPRKSILFIEDIGEEPYRVDRMIHQLKLAGVFDKIKGLIVGQFTDYNEDDRMYASLNESIMTAVREYTFPVCFDFPVGHAKHNFPMLMGERASLNVKKKQILFKQK